MSFLVFDCLAIYLFLYLMGSVFTFGAKIIPYIYASLCINKRNKIRRRTQIQVASQICE